MAGEVLDPRENLLLPSSLTIYPSEVLTLIEDTSFETRRGSYRDWVILQKINDCGLLSPKWYIYSETSTPAAK